jgi:N-acetylglucosamine transport system substrate-binding protein
MSGKNKVITRREFLRLAGVGAATSLLAACGPTLTPTPAPTPAPKVITPAPAPVTIEVMFPGDPTLARGSKPYLDEVVKIFNERYPYVTVKLTVDPNIDQIERPRLIQGNPPDVLDIWTLPGAELVRSGLLLPIDEALKGPSWDDPKVSWESTFLPGVFDATYYSGKRFFIPHSVGVVGWFYNAGLFEKKGWKVPATVEELLAWGEECKAAGISPIVYAGKYVYNLAYWWPDLIAAYGGPEAFRPMDELKDNAWEQDYVRKAFEVVRQVRDRNFFSPGSAGLGLDEAMAEFFQGKAAIVWGGDWQCSLPQDPTRAVPADFKMRYMRTPYPADAPYKNFHRHYIGARPTIPSQAKQPEWGFEFMKAATSLQAAKPYYDYWGLILPVKGGETVVTDECRLSAARIAAETTTPRIMFWSWYAEANTELANLTTAFALGQIKTTDEFLSKVQAAFDKDRANPAVVKHTWDESFKSPLEVTPTP